MGSPVSTANEAGFFRKFIKIFRNKDERGRNSIGKALGHEKEDQQFDIR